MSKRTRRTLLWSWLVASLVAVVLAPAANAEFGLAGSDVTVLGADGTASTTAGAHPASQTVSFALNTVPDSTGLFQVSDGAGLRHAMVDLPPGFVGNPTVAATCPEDLLNARFTPACSRESQVGVARVTTAAFDATFPVFNMEPSFGAPAVFGMRVVDVPVHLRARLRNDGEYGLSVDSLNISQATPITAIAVTMWGVPSDPSHDAARGGPSTLPPRPFLTNPTRCTAPGEGLETTLEIQSWDRPPVTEMASLVTHEPGDPDAVVGIDGCENVPFEPTVDVAVDSLQPDSPTGLAVDMTFPQHGLETANALATAHLRDARVALPEGMSISPSAANGLAACSDTQMGIGNGEPVACPDASKIGSVKATSPLLKDELTGGVYVAEQKSSDPASGEMFRMFIELENEERGLLIKLNGQVRADPATGQLVTSFEDNPQLPVSTLSLRLKGGARAPLATPPTCGPKTVTTELTSWAGHDLELTDGFTVACPGAAGFAPSFSAGSVSPVGGAFSPFTLGIERDDRQQYLSKVAVDMPRGLLAKLAGVEKCPDSVAGEGTPGVCPSGSRVGTATVTAGPGSNPFSLRGGVYLTGPYKGAPYGLAVQVHAKAGPFDLGWVKVRNALHVDPETAQASVISDPLPQIVKGVPVRLRSAHVDVDRPGFTVNPTSCAEKRVAATLTSIGGAVDTSSSRFQVGDCSALAFKPKLGMRLVGKRQMKSGGHPALRATLRQASGQANIEAAKVTLPPNVVLDSKNSVDPKLLCGYDAALKADCPASSIIGKASLKTPLLNRPLSGPVHFVQGIRFENGNRIRTLPTLLVKLRGEVAINLRSTTQVDSKDRLVSRFPNVPDARANRFDIQINGGREGILVVTENRRGRINLCNRKQTALVETDGHNGRRADYPIRVKTPCAKSSKKRKR